MILFFFSSLFAFLRFLLLDSRLSTLPPLLCHAMPSRVMLFKRAQKKKTGLYYVMSYHIITSLFNDTISHSVPSVNQEECLIFSLATPRHRAISFIPIAFLVSKYIYFSTPRAPLPCFLTTINCYLHIIHIIIHMAPPPWHMWGGADRALFLLLVAAAAAQCRSGGPPAGLPIFGRA